MNTEITISEVLACYVSIKTSLPSQSMGGTLHRRNAAGVEPFYAL